MIMDHHTWYQSIDYREFEQKFESTSRQQVDQYKSVMFELYPYSPSSYYQPPPTEPEESCRFGVTMEEFSRSVDERFAAEKEEMNSIKVEIKEMSSKLDQVLEMMREILDHTVHVHQTPATNEELSNQLVRLEQIGDERHAAVEIFASNVKAQSEEIMELRMNQRGKGLNTAESVTHRLSKHHEDGKEVIQNQLDALQPENYYLPSSTFSKGVLVPTFTEADLVRGSAKGNRIDDVSVYDVQQEMIKSTREGSFVVQGTKEHKVFDEMTERDLNNANNEVLCTFYYSDLVNELKVYYDVCVLEISDWKVIMNGYSVVHVRGVRESSSGGNLLAFGSVKAKRVSFDPFDLPSDVRTLARIVYSAHGGEIAIAFLRGGVHIFSGASFALVDNYQINVGSAIAAPAFSSTSCCSASVCHDVAKDRTILKIIRVLPPAVSSSQVKSSSSTWERAIAEKFWWSFLVGVDWWDAVGCTQSAAEDGIVSLNSVIAVLDADFHSLPSTQHRQQYGPSLDRIKCRLLEGTNAQEVRAWYVSNGIWPLKIFRNNMVSSKDDVRVSILEICSCVKFILMLEDKHLEMGRVIVMTRALKTESKTQHFMSQSTSAQLEPWCPNDELA